MLPGVSALFFVKQKLTKKPKHYGQLFVLRSVVGAVISAYWDDVLHRHISFADGATKDVTPTSMTGNFTIAVGQFLNQYLYTVDKGTGNPCEPSPDHSTN